MTDVRGLIVQLQIAIFQQVLLSTSTELLISLDLLETKTKLALGKGNALLTLTDSQMRMFANLVSAS